MSFILDALKKAEAERQRQTGPTLLEVRISAPRRRFPVWMLVIGGLLGINILLLILFALHRPGVVAAGAAPATPASAPPAAATAATTATAASAVPSPAAQPPLVPAATAPAAAPTAPMAPTSTAPLAGVPATDSRQNPADLEPALPAAGASPAASPPQNEADNGQEPPNLSDVGGDMPNLRLDLHVYAARAADRYALINMHRVREGDVLPEGPRVLAISRDGVKLSYRGTEFMLRPQ
ncbi:MAG TPA: general secretion pathway protein GspB [Steroidobacteraceae bacterium]